MAKSAVAASRSYGAANGNAGENLFIIPRGDGEKEEIIAVLRR